MNLSEGERRKEGGQDSALDAQDEWRERVYSVFRHWAVLPGKTFTSDDLREYFHWMNLGEPRHPSSWGAVFTAAGKLKIIRRLPRRVKSTAPKCHAAEIAVWTGFSQPDEIE